VRKRGQTHKTTDQDCEGVELERSLRVWPPSSVFHKFDFFVTIKKNTHIVTLRSVEDKALLYQL
jgi:hypothetical protein